MTYVYVVETRLSSKHKWHMYQPSPIITHVFRDLKRAKESIAYTRHLYLEKKFRVAKYVREEEAE